jgi:hypothetical protein
MANVELPCSRVRGARRASGDAREACCVARNSRCGTRFPELRRWVCRVTGKGVQLVVFSGDGQGRAPFFAQPVGFDGRAFFVGDDRGCDTEKLLHEACHWLVASRDRRSRQNYGLGPGPGQRLVDDVVGDNEEVTVMLLERLLAPHFALDEAAIARPDYNVVSRRHVDWDACTARAEEAYRTLRSSL